MYVFFFPTSSDSAHKFCHFRCRNIWVFKWCLWAQRNGQKSHWNGFSPVWILMCRFKSHEDRNSFPQTSQVLTTDQVFSLVVISLLKNSPRKYKQKYMDKLRTKLLFNKLNKPFSFIHEYQHLSLFHIARWFSCN